MRRDALEGHAAQVRRGLALLMREGLAAWMEAWCGCIAPTPPSPHEPREAERGPEFCESGAELVQVLASMALCHLQECHP
jgi:hypothetical protein